MRCAAKTIQTRLGFPSTRSVAGHALNVHSALAKRIIERLAGAAGTVRNRVGSCPVLRAWRRRAGYARRRALVVVDVRAPGPRPATAPRLTPAGMSRKNSSNRYFGRPQVDRPAASARRGACRGRARCRQGQHWQASGRARTQPLHRANSFRHENGLSMSVGVRERAPAPARSHRRARVRLMIGTCLVSARPHRGIARCPERAGQHPSCSSVAGRILEPRSRRRRAHRLDVVAFASRL